VNDAKSDMKTADPGAVAAAWLLKHWIVLVLLGTSIALAQEVVLRGLPNFFATMPPRLVRLVGGYLVAILTYRLFARSWHQAVWPGLGGASVCALPTSLAVHVAFFGIFYGAIWGTIMRFVVGLPAGQGRAEAGVTTATDNGVWDRELDG
jgi:hypothetical protein